MNKILLVVTMILLLAVPAMAVDLGKGVILDGFITAGKLLNVSHEEIGDYDKYTLTSEKGSYFVQSEIGMRYDVDGIVRPFIAYETLMNSYDQRGAGVDIFIYQTGNILMGLRTEYVHLIRSGVDKQNMIYSGVMVRF